MARLGDQVVGLPGLAVGVQDFGGDAFARFERPVHPGGLPFPERRHIVALVAAFVTDYLLLIERWSEFARDEIRQWPRTDGLGMTDRTRQILDDVLAGNSAIEHGR